MPVERKHKQLEAIANFNYWLNDAINQDEYEEMIFFYHKDHLGSSTQISDIDANIIQHIEYLPYGETFFERRSYWNTPYKFNAKELDAETGMYYYGARYYTSEVSIWLSVDPLADKYPSMSAFMYCAGNPMRYIDPDGRSLGDYFGIEGNYLGSDGEEDGKVYVVNTEANSLTQKECKVIKNAMEGGNDPNNIIKNNTKLLSLSKDELLDRARWIYGEGGDATGENGEKLSDYYAWTIKNARSSYSSEKSMMISKMAVTKTINNYEAFMNNSYDTKGRYGSFYRAQEGGINNLNKSIPTSKGIIASIIQADINYTKDPTNGSIGWLGGGRPGRKNSLGESYSTSIRIRSTDNMYHYFHKYN